ncbi:hypothetical protein Tco_1370181 [Tanacetum coccineum]
MLAPSGEGLILYQAYGNLCAMTGRKAHLLEDKKILSVGVFDEVSFYTLFRGIKLLGHTMKLWERVIEKKLRRETREDIPWCMIFADDIVLVSESAEGLNNILENWREALKENSIRASRKKTDNLSYGKTMLDMIPNEVYKAEIEVETIINKMREDGSRRRGRPKLRWEDRLKNDMKELLLSEDMTSDRNKWRARIRLVG